MRFMVVLVMALSSVAHAQLHRFYRGYALPGRSPQEFIRTMNESFFPLFIEAVPHGLISYKPVLLNEARSTNIPNEVVLLTFKDQATYEAYGKTPIGQSIRAAHGPIFDSEKSKSLVPAPFTGTTELEKAYIFNPEFQDFKAGASGLLILSAPYGASAITLRDVDSVFAQTGKANIISLVSDGVVYEYLFAKDEAALEKLRRSRCSQFKRAFGSSKFVLLQKHKVGERTVDFGEGMDLQW